jgi:hypothetical protein
MFDLYSIQIASAGGGTYTCGFRAEEWKPGEFAMFCEAPFVRQRSTGQAKETVNLHGDQR